MPKIFARFPAHGAGFPRGKFLAFFTARAQSAGEKRLKPLISTT
ncbi:hypothetical protein QDY71_11625 [Kingella negevensis]|nr:hypothetical protein [Kingella negevensis]MDK4685630.1 hypothetical protein [Kingella negevensis]MDK4698371.1 hypothetical protein [Kingella negevensis]MDK4708800.1 hypothetical protein [Kingella negevensis]MDK4711029.1 hypothetical protein [Kingella negevensis]